MNKVKKTPIQIRAENTHSAEEFLAELKARLRVGGLTCPDPVIANLQRRPAFRHLHQHIIGMKNLLKIVKSKWCLVGNSAAICYGTTRISDNVDICIDSTGDDYRLTEIALVDAGWKPIFVDEIRYKHHPNFVVRSWWNENGKQPRHGSFCRRLNLIVPAGPVQWSVLDSNPPASPVKKQWPVASTNLLFAMKASLGRPIDIADMIEIVQGGADIQWGLIRQMIFRSGIGGDEIIQSIQSIAGKMKRPKVDM